MATESARSTIVIYRLGSLGDTIVALPCFNLVARRYRDATRLVLTNIPVSAKAAPLLAVLGDDGSLVHGAIAYPLGTRSPLRLVTLLRTLRALQADTLVYMLESRGAWSAWRDWLFFRLAGFRQIVAFPATKDRRESRVDPQTGIVEPESQRLARCFAGLGPIDLQDPRSWDLHLSAGEWQAARTFLDGFAGRPYVAVNMGGKAAEKDWGLENWLKLFRRLEEHCVRFGLLVVGAASDRDRGERLMAQWSGPTANACGVLTPRQSAAAMAGAAIFIGHDSGPLHLAAAMGAPCVGLFGDFNRPNQWHPHGRKVTTVHNMSGIAAITVDEVERAVSIAIAKRD